MNAHIADTVTAILTQANLGEEFRKDFEKAVAAVYAAGETSKATHYHSAPLTDAEIALVRAKLLA